MTHNERECLRATITGIGDAIVELDPQGRVTFLNSLAQFLTGWSQEQAEGQPLESVFQPISENTRNPVENLALRVLRGGIVVRLAGQSMLIAKSGRKCLIDGSAAAIQDEEGRIVGVVVVFRDISEGERAAAHIRQLLAAEKRHSVRLGQVAQAARTINGCHSLENVLRVLPEEARRIIATHRSVSSMTVNEDWTHAVNTTSFTDKYAEWLNRDFKPDGTGLFGPVCREFKAIRLTHPELEAHPSFLRAWLAVPLVGGDGRNLGLLQVSDKLDGEDFTEEDEAILVELALIGSVAIENAQLYEELQQRDRSKDHFLATLAHELRNPLAPIRNALQILKLSGSGEETVNVRDLMERQVQHIVRLVDDLLDVSRIIRGFLEIRKAPLELATVVQRAVETSRPLVESARHELTVSLPPEPLLVDGDLIRLAQVLSNLLNNACKYTQDGGHIWLTVDRDGGEAVIGVRDNGTGIRAEMLPRIWEMFTQAQRNLARAQGGLGIGLTLVRRLVEMHDGRVEAFSAGLGQGSTFTVRLPLAKEKSERPETGGQAPEGQQTLTAAHCRILVVDDNIDSAQSLAMLLQLAAHEVRTAHDGPSALDVAAAFTPDVVLLDIGLPGMDGLEVARRMRAMPHLRDTALIAQTGWGGEEDRHRSEEAGFNAHLAKPVDFAVLQRLLAAFAKKQA